MSAPELAVQSRGTAFLEELRKLPAFFRRDLLVLFSYRMAFFGDWGSLLVQVVLFSFVSRMVDPTTMPVYAGRQVTYLEFVTVGIAVGAFLTFGLGRVVSVVRSEQVTGTLESLLSMPLALTTFQLGSALYDMIYIPLRTLIFIGLVVALFDVQVAFSNIGPALVVLVAFAFVVWGLGLISAAAVLTFRRGGGFIGLGTMALAASSGAYFPVDLLPTWAQGLMRFNPITITLETARNALLGDAGWSQTTPDLLLLLPLAALTIGAGTLLFRVALQRELRRGTLHLY